MRPWLSVDTRESLPPGKGKREIRLSHRPAVLLPPEGNDFGSKGTLHHPVSY